MEWGLAREIPAYDEWLGQINQRFRRSVMRVFIGAWASNLSMDYERHNCMCACVAAVAGGFGGLAAMSGGSDGFAGGEDGDVNRAWVDKGGTPVVAVLVAVASTDVQWSQGRYSMLLCTSDVLHHTWEKQ